MGKNLSSNGVSFNLFRHQTAQNVLNLKELDAVWRHLFLKKEKELGLHATCLTCTLRAKCFLAYQENSYRQYFTLLQILKMRDLAPNNLHAMCILPHCVQP